MKIKVCNATPKQLDWLTAKCEGTLPTSFDDWKQTWPGYSTKWSDGGPIIERLGILLQSAGEDGYRAYLKSRGTSGPTATGSDHLTAAMRLCVFSELGDEVDVPDELAEVA